MTALFTNLTVCFVAFIINIPLGHKRENYPKMSAAWLFWIHASIPLIIFLRYQLDTSTYMIPVNIAFAVIGQIVGSRIRRKQLESVQRA